MGFRKQYKSKFGDIWVSHYTDGTIGYYQHGSYQSQSWPDGTSVFPHVHVVYQIIVQKKARKALVIGCGGGNLATMLAREGVQVAVVDINPVAFTIARAHFNMPESVTCIEQDGLKFVSTTDQRFDAVFVDAFGGKNALPPGFTSKAFFEKIKKIMLRRGIFIMNALIKDKHDQSVEKLGKTIADATALPTHIYAWSNAKHSNRIIVSGDIKGVAIPSGKEPEDIQHLLRKIVFYKPNA